MGSYDLTALKPDSVNEPVPSADAVEEQLRAILASPAFHGSRRCSDFLQFVVRRKLEGRSDELKERTIATEVFERGLLYEPKLDSFVRVKANDLRKRLAQYYQTAGSSAKVRIDLPQGAYVPTLELIQADRAPIAVKEPRASSRRWAVLVLGAACLCALTAGVVLWAVHAAVPSDVERFWGLFLASPKPVTVCIVPSPLVRFADPSKAAALLSAQPGRRRYEFSPGSPLDLGPATLYEVDGLFYIGSAFVLAGVSHSLGELHKPMIIKGGQEISLTDMRDSPAVLIGAFNNQWAVELNAGRRFTYVFDSGIRDIKTGRVYEARRVQGKVIEDYGLVSRLVRSATGGPLVTIGGVTHYATQSAAEMIAEPEHLRQLIRALPAGWQVRNVQILLTGYVLDSGSH